MTRVMACGLLLLLTVVGPACGKKVVVVQLTPSEVVTKSDEDEDHEDVVCLTPCGINLLTTCRPEVYSAPQTAFVGYSRGYDDGTPPCDCWAWRSCFSRAYVKFDLSSVPSADIVTARLHWSPKTEKNAGGVASNDGTCAKQIYVAKQPWGPVKIAGESLDLGAVGTFALVPEVVARWKKGETPNHGFFFVGPDESLPGKNGDDCLTELANLGLEVVAAVKK
jgi:hypothetical protein